MPRKSEGVVRSSRYPWGEKEERKGFLSSLFFFSLGACVCVEPTHKCFEIMLRSYRLNRLSLVFLFFFLVCVLFSIRVFFFRNSVKRSFASEENGVFWSKHFYYTQNVAWDDYALSMFLEYADRNITREKVAVLSPIIDANRDGRVSLEENLSFLIKFSQSQGGHYAAIREAL